MKQPTRLFVLFMMLTGCAYSPIIDPTGINHNQYALDKAECTVIADQVNTGGQAAGGTLFGAALGAALGAIIFAVTDNADAASTVALGAGIGGVSGGVEGASKGYETQANVVRNCLRGRGYNVLN
jgi:hypothetical protein